LEGVVCIFRDKVGLQYNLSDVERWIDREGQHDFGGYVDDVHHEPIEEMGGVPSIGRIFLQ